MKKSKFNSRAFYISVLVLLTILFLWNLYLTILTSNIIGLLPLSIQSVLIYLIYTKNQYAKILIQIWSVVFLSIASGLQFVGQFLQDVGSGYVDVDLSSYIINAIKVIIGILIFSFAKNTILVEVEEK